MTKTLSWQEEKRASLAQAKCVVVKVGSAVLTNGSVLDENILENLVKQIVALQDAKGKNPRRVILVSSGAVASGRAVLHPRGIQVASMAEKQAAAAVGQGHLMHLYNNAFARHGAISAQVLLTRDDLKDRLRFLNARNTFAHLLNWNAIPVVNENDTISVDEIRFSDNDNLSSLLLNLAEADLFINLTSTNGVFAANPLTTPDAKIMPCIEQIRSLDLPSLCGGKTTVGRGGMYSKLLSATRAAQLGVPTLILPGHEPDVITRTLAGEEFGTWVRPEEHPVSRRKYWLAYQTEAQDAVHVDDGAAHALASKGGSLLPGGILSVDGTFAAGTLVRIVHNGKNIGVGLSNYAAADILRICGLKREEVKALLGDAHYAEVIHRDNLLIDAAV